MSTKAHVERLADQAKDIASTVRTTVAEKAGALRENVAASGPGAAVDQRMKRVHLPGRRSQTAHDANQRAQEKSNRRLQHAERKLAEAEENVRRAREQAAGATASARRTSGSSRRTGLDALSKKELLERAGRLDITGRSRMTKAQLARALRKTGQG